jgi:lipopolysaccharide/colanic/teichoic acid biosynthesis glycosyltransferase
MNWPRLLRRSKAVSPSHRILGMDDFQLALEKERLRSDRNGSCFCLVTLELRHDESLERDLEAIGDVLCNRLRRTDEIGKIRSSIFGLLLPETPVQGAWKVVDDIIELLPLKIDPPHCSVYSYPTQSQDAFPTDDELQSVQANSRVVKPLEQLLCQRMPVWKRTVDVAGASIGLLVLSPVLIAASAFVKCTSKGPVLFCQDRMGLGGRPFKMLKFRTMRNGAHLEQAKLRTRNEQDGPAFKLSNDPRITWSGKFLRRTCMDELPQLWNVLRGEMSLVGPRPLPCSESNACLNWQKQRLDITPGLTCYWQISNRSEVRFVDWMRLDLKYGRQRSLLLDFMLIFRTFRMVLGAKGK